MSEYDIVSALQGMEEELILSMKRNLQRHLKEEADEGFGWTQWQAEKLNGIARYRAQNAEIIGKYTSTIPDMIDEMIRKSYESGKNQEEIKILKALKNGYTASAGTVGEIGTEFFTINERKLNALIAATQGEMRKATSSILRYQEDIYRQTIFRSAAQFNTGGKTLYQAVDAAAHDFLAAGIQNIRYRDGRQVNISSYAEMALRTANLRANIQGEAAKRDEWGVRTVKMSSHGSACPKCIPWQGKVYYDDVYSSLDAPTDGKYPLLSTAIDGGALHPNCKNGVSTWFEGINKPPEEMTEEEIMEANRRYDLEQKQRYYERNVRKYKRLSIGSLDPENAAKYAAKEKEWRGRLRGLVKDNPDVLRMDYARLKLYDVDAMPGKKVAVNTNPKPKKPTGSVPTSVTPAGANVPATATISGSEKLYKTDNVSENIKHLKGNYSVQFSKAGGSKEITPQLAKEFSDEYDKFEEKFGKLSSVRGVTVAPYGHNGVWGSYNDNSNEIIIFGVGGKDGKTTLSKVASDMKKAGKWSTSSPYHAFRHELGHALQYQLKQSDPSYPAKLQRISEIRNSAFEALTNLDKGAIIEAKKKILSLYGLEDDLELDEFISECVAECCSKKPRKTARDVVDVLLNGVDDMLVDYPSEWRNFMIQGKTRTFSQNTPNEIIEKAKKINEELMRYAGKPFFFFEESEQNKS